MHAPRLFSLLFPVLAILCLASAGRTQHPTLETTDFVPSFFGGTSERFMTFLVQEDEDFNGDGDAFDTYPVVLELDTGFSVSLPYAAHFRVTVLREWVALVVTEPFHDGRDHNGDGDVADNIPFLHHLPSGELRVLPLAVGGHDLFDVADAGLLFGVDERRQGGTDLNGDGDADDHVLHLHDPETGDLSNSGFAYSRGSVLQGNKAIVHVSEAGQGGTDLNGDGDAVDTVVHVLDLEDMSLWNTGIANASSSVEKRSSLVGLCGDEGCFVLDAVSERIFPLPGDVRWLRVRSPYAAYLLAESETDLNGDGDLADSILHVLDATDGSTRIVPFAGSDFGLPGDGILYFSVSEPDQGGADLNGDGDAADVAIAHTVDLRTGAVTNLALTAPTRSTSSARSILRVPEALATADLNGDGDLLDAIGYLVDGTTGTILPTGMVTGHVGTTAPGMTFFATVDEQAVFSVDSGTGTLLDQEVTLQSHPFPFLTDDVATFRDRRGRLRFLRNGNWNSPYEGSVNRGAGARADVLFLNGEAGTDRLGTVGYTVGGPIELEIRRPPAVGLMERAPFVIYAWRGQPEFGDSRRLPFGLGAVARPMPLTGGHPQPLRILSSAGRVGRLGRSDFPVEAAPIVIQRSRDNQIDGFYYFQGVIFDPGSPSGIPASVTNGILAKPDC